MAATQLFYVGGTSRLTLEDCTTDGNYATGIYATDDATVELHRCKIDANEGRAIQAVATVDVDLTTHDPTLVASDTSASSPAPSWELTGRATLKDCSGQGLYLGGIDSIVTGFNATGICDTAGIILAGSRNTIIGGHIAVQAPVGLLAQDALCGRATSIQILAGFDNNETNIDGYAVQVTGDNVDPEVRLDAIDICGPGTVFTVTYGCNVEPNDCSGLPCDVCAERVCDEDSPLGDGVSSDCWDPNCWPPPELRDQAQFGTCTSNAGLWDVQTSIKTTRAVDLTFRDLTAGAISNIYRPNVYDCLVEAVLNVYTDDYDGALGDTEVRLIDDTTGLDWNIVCPANSASASLLINKDLYPEGPIFLPSNIRAELVSITTPVTVVEASVTLRLP